MKTYRDLWRARAERADEERDNARREVDRLTTEAATLRAEAESAKRGKAELADRLLAAQEAHVAVTREAEALRARPVLTAEMLVEPLIEAVRVAHIAYLLGGGAWEPTQRTIDALLAATSKPEGGPTS